MAQIFPRVRTSSSESQHLLNESLKDVICFLHVEYQLEDTVSHERFNIEEKDYFGCAEGLCIKTDNGWIATNDLAAPWISNPDLKKFPGHIPYISSASFLSPSDTVWSEVALPNRFTSDSIKGTAFSIVNDTVSFPSHMTIGISPKPLNGWIAWISKNDNHISIRYQSHNVAESDSTNILRPIVPEEDIIGAFYVVPRYPAPGEIKFELAGLVDYNDSEWQLILLGGSSQDLVPTDDKPRLVPAKQKGQKEDKAERKPSRKKNK